jgi:hypothetical protein
MPNFRAFHTIELKPDVERESFEDFMLRKFLPEVRALPGCLNIQFLKGYQGDLAGVAKSKYDYAWITLWESVEANNAVWTGWQTPEPARHPGSQCRTVSLRNRLLVGWRIYCRSINLVVYSLSSYGS